MSKPNFKINLGTIEDIVERQILEVMSAQQFIDLQTQIERDRYGLAIKNFKPEIRDLFRAIIPTRPVLVNSSFKLNVSISTSKSISGGLHARLLNAIEVAGFEIYKETRTTIGCSLQIEINQTLLPSAKLGKEKEP